MEPITIIIGLVALLLGSVITFFVIKNLDLAKSKSLLRDAEKEAERIKKEKILQSKEKFIELKSQHDKSINEKNQEFNKSQNRVKEKVIILNNTSLFVRIANNEESRSNGLREVDSIEDSEGMLFVHDHPDQHIYNMHNMKFDLDFIFIKENKIVDIAKSISYSYKGAIKGGTAYDKVIEVNADWVKKHNIKIADEVRLD